MACVLSGISGSVIGGRAGAERRAAKSGRRCGTTISPPHSLFNVEIGRGGAVRQPPLLPPAGRGLNFGWSHALKILESAQRDGSLNLLLKTPRVSHAAPVFSCAREGPSAGGFDPAAPAPSYRVGFDTTRSKPLAEGHSGGCALWLFGLSDRRPCERRTARGKSWSPVRDNDFAAAFTF